MKGSPFQRNFGVGSPAKKHTKGHGSSRLTAEYKEKKAIKKQESLIKKDEDAYDQKAKYGKWLESLTPEQRSQHNARPGEDLGTAIATKLAHGAKLTKGKEVKATPKPKRRTYVAPIEAKGAEMLPVDLADEPKLEKADYLKGVS